MSQTAEARRRAALSQPNASDIDFESQFEGCDCASEEVQTWALGSRKLVVSLVRLLDEEEEEGVEFSTPMEVTIMSASSYQPSPGWRDRFISMDQVAVYTNMNRT